MTNEEKTAKALYKRFYKILMDGKSIKEMAKECAIASLENMELVEKAWCKQEGNEYDKIFYLDVTNQIKIQK
jgi:hypothetical protein